MKTWKEKIVHFAIKNRKTTLENRRRVGKSLSLLAVFLFAVFLVNFAVIIGKVYYFFFPGFHILLRRSDIFIIQLQFLRIRNSCQTL